MLELLKKLLYNRKNDKRAVNIMDERMLAKDVLKKHWNGKLPVDLDRICAENNIQIKYEHLEPLEENHGQGQISGVMFIQDKDNKFIVVNKKDNEKRQRFTIAHELGHYFLHMSDQDYENTSMVSFRGRSNKHEREANLFAAELLMPEDVVKREYELVLYPLASFLARRFDVSEAAMSVRIKEMGLKYIG